MGNWFYTPLPPPQQPIIIQSGNPSTGQTTLVYSQPGPQGYYGPPPQGYYYGPSGQLLELALVADIATDIVIMDDIIDDDGFYGGKKNEKNSNNKKKEKKEKSKK
jgi:hypothetical protein